MTLFLDDGDVRLFHGDALDVLRGLPDGCVDACVTSPPYLDARPEYPSPTHVEWRVIFAELRRVVAGPALFNVGRLWRDRTEVLWWVDLVRIAQSAGWPLLDTLVWIKPNANPIHGQVFANRHEYVLILGEPDVELGIDAVRVPYAPSSVPRLKRGWTNHTGVKNDTGRKNGRRQSEPHPLGGRPPSYVEVYTGREKGNPHPAPMALDLALHLVKLSGGSTILDPFAGSGTTAVAARKLGRASVLIERDKAYCELTADRLSQLSLLAEGTA